MEVLTNARRIRKAVFFFLARDLGLRQKVRRLEFCTAARLGLTLHPKKTCITPISAGISFLKIRYSFTETGRVLKVPDPAIFTRERRRLKKLAAFVAQGEISADEYNLLWRSWCGSFRAFDCRRALNDLQHDKERFLKDALSRKL